MSSHIKLELLKRKEEHAQSAIASLEVREHLAGFIRSKRQLGGGSSTHLSSPGPSSGSQHPKSNALSSLVGTSKDHESRRSHSNLDYQSSGDQFQFSDDGQSTCRIGEASQRHMEVDRTLRKTASMPTIHNPLKSLSMSRKRQIERRTTMSPLMRKKTKPSSRKQLHSLDLSEPQDFSSNPCIIKGSSSINVSHSDRLIRSLSQSGSPPRCMSRTGPVQDDTSSHIPSPTLCTYESNNPNQSAHLSETTNHLSSITQTDITSPSKSNPENSDLDQLTKQQHHLKVQAALRKTLIDRTSSRARIAAVGGSLDSGSELVARRASINQAANLLLQEYGNQSGTGDQSSNLKDFSQCEQASQVNTNGRISFSSNREELRQWSLDAADLRSLHAARAAGLAAAWASGSNAQANRTLAWGMFNRDLLQLRLAATNAASLLRRSQSPQSSISMGSNEHASDQLQAQQSIPSSHGSSSSHQERPIGHRKPKHLSSSSSSDSSLLSGQDSFDDSSSQAIDLSSSSEAHKQRHKKHQHHQQQLHSSRMNYQNILQESFNQLQLQSGDSPKRLFFEQQQQLQLQQTQISATERAGDHKMKQDAAQFPPETVSQKLAMDHGQQQQQKYSQSPNRGTNDNQMSALASVMGQHTMTTGPKGALAATQASHQQIEHEKRRQQFHLSSLVASQNQASANPVDLHSWSAYTSLMQSEEFQQSSQITSSLWTKMTSLPEPYRSSLLAQWIQLHQQYHHDPYTSDPHPQISSDGNPNSSPSHDQRSLISRALSSPLLIGNKGPQYDTTRSFVTQRATDHTGLRERPSSGKESDAASRNFAQSLSGHCQSGNKSEPDSESREQVSLDLSYFNLNRVNSDESQTTSSKSNDEERSLRSRTSASDSSAEQRGNRDDSTSQRVNFSYTPQDLAQVCCNFIYTPTFSEDSRTGITYDLDICAHKCICMDESQHPENNFRVLAIWRRLFDVGLMIRCARIRPYRASLRELQLCHGGTYTRYFGLTPHERASLDDLDLSKLPIKGLTQLDCGGIGADIDTAWNEEQTPRAVRTAVGAVIEAASSIIRGQLTNAFAIIRPPGHHAEFEQAMGFCFFNSVGIAARVIQTTSDVERILIVDWDVHHGNGLQKMFYADKEVMYISLHRHDRGNFFPGTGDLNEVGFGEAEGYNWNIAWSNEAMADAEYIAAFRSIVMPISREFNPSFVLVACGYDAAQGHSFNFGGYDLSPACFSYMTRQLMTLAEGRILLCLEGGYHLKALCDCSEACVRALLEDTSTVDYNMEQDKISKNPLDQIDECELRREPNQSACEVLHEVSNLAAKYWPSVDRWRPTIGMSANEAQRHMKGIA